MSLRLKSVATVPVPVEILIGKGADAIRGTITGHAIIRTKDEMKEIGEREWENDAEFVRFCYAKIEGIESEAGTLLEGDEAFAEVCHGKFSTYLVPALCAAYVEHYGDARVGNSKRSRSR
jgi:hypothetical protein